MTQLSRRQILAGATAAVAAMPAAAIAKGMPTAPVDAGFKGFKAMPFVLDEADDFSSGYDFVKAISEVKAASQRALDGLGPDVQWAWLVDEDGKPITGEVEIVGVVDGSERESA